MTETETNCSTSKIQQANIELFIKYLPFNIQKQLNRADKAKIDFINGRYVYLSRF